MNDTKLYYTEEPFLHLEIILGMALAIGMLLIVVSEVFSMVMIGLAGISVAGIYLVRIYKMKRDRGEAIQCCFSWFNNGAMVLAVTGILMLMLMNTFHRPVFYTVLAIISIVMLLNGIFYSFNIRGMTHITAQIRLVIALVILLVFFLL